MLPGLHVKMSTFQVTSAAKGGNIFEGHIFRKYLITQLKTMLSVVIFLLLACARKCAVRNEQMCCGQDRGALPAGVCIAGVPW